MKVNYLIFPVIAFVLFVLTNLFNHSKSQPVDISNPEEVNLVIPQETEEVTTSSGQETPKTIPVTNPQHKGEVAGVSTGSGYFNVEVFNKVNEYRRNNGLNTLITHPTLNAVAQCRINYLIDHNIWSHHNFGACFYSHGVNPDFAENLARGYNMDPTLVFNAWLASPSHNSIMLYQKWNYVGTVTDRGYTVLVFSVSM